MRHPVHRKKQMVNLDILTPRTKDFLKIFYCSTLTIQRRSSNEKLHTCTAVQNSVQKHSVAVNMWSKLVLLHIAFMAPAVYFKKQRNNIMLFRDNFVYIKQQVKGKRQHWKCRYEIIYVFFNLPSLLHK